MAFLTLFYLQHYITKRRRRIVVSPIIFLKYILRDFYLRELHFITFLREKVYPSSSWTFSDCLVSSHCIFCLQNLFQANSLSGNGVVLYEEHTVLTGVKLPWLLHIQLLLFSANAFWLVLLPVSISIRFLLMCSNMLFHYAGEFGMSHIVALLLLVSNIYFSNWFPAVSGAVHTVLY